MILVGMAMEKDLSYNGSKYRLVRVKLRSMAINRVNIREVSLCKWIIWLPEMYTIIICIFYSSRNFKDFSD